MCVFCFVGIHCLPLSYPSDCQFIALCYSGGIPVSHEHLRREICDYLIAMEEIFAPHFDSRWPTYAAYVQNMRQDGSWGDDLTLTAAAHLLLKPIRIVSDLDIEFREFHRPASPPNVGALVSPWLTSNSPTMRLRSRWRET